MYPNHTQLQHNVMLLYVWMIKPIITLHAFLLFRELGWLMNEERVLGLLSLSCSLLNWYQCINGVWNTPKNVVLISDAGIHTHATSQVHTHTCIVLYIQQVYESHVYLCVHVSLCILWGCNPQLQLSLCVMAGLKLESRCNFPSTKTPTSGTRGERNIL